MREKKPIEQLHVREKEPIAPFHPREKDMSRLHATKQWSKLALGRSMSEQEWFGNLSELSS